MGNPLTDHPWLKDLQGVQKSAGRLRTPVILLDADELRSLDLSTALWAFVGERLFKKDTTQTAPDNDFDLLVDAGGNRWRGVTGNYFEFAGSWTLGLGPGEVLLVHRFASNVAFDEDFAGSVGIALTTATLQKTISVRKNGNTALHQVGTVTFNPALPDPVFDCPGGVAFLRNDYAVLVAPASADATLANIGLTIVGTR